MSWKSRRWLWLLLMLPIAFGLARLRFDPEVLNLLPGESDVVEGLKVYQQNFSNGRELVVTVQSDDAERTESAARHLAATLRQSTHLVSSVHWQPPWVEQPEHSAELVAYLWINQPPEIFNQLVDRLASSNVVATLAATKEQLAISMSPNEIAMGSYDPLGLTQLPENVSAAMPIGSGDQIFSSPDGKFRILFVEASRNLSNYRDCRDWLNSIKNIIAQSQQSADFPTGIQLQYTGRPAFVTEIAGGMESDLAGPSAWTLAIIALLFYGVHRRWMPLVWLMFFLAIALAITLAFGGLIFGTLNVVSLGFASILLGLAEDFGIVIYQESRSHPEFTLQELRRETRTGIFWSAITTAGAFLLLNLSSLPGLGQLGSLVALGVIIAAIVMQYGYLPLVMRSGIRLSKNVAPHHEPAANAKRYCPSKSSARAVWLGTFASMAALVFICVKNGPSFDNSLDALRPKDSPAYATVDKIKTQLGNAQEPLWLLTSGRDEEEVAARLERVESELRRAVSNQWIADFTLPTTLWPQPQNQLSNRAALKTRVAEKATLREAVLANGFTANSFALTERLFDTWQNVLVQTNLFWPTNQASRWIMDKVVAQTTNGFVAAGLVYPATNFSGETDAAKTERFTKNLASTFADTPPSEIENPSSKTILSGWSLLGDSMLDLVKRDLPRVVIPILALVITSLWLAFRSLRELFLSLLTIVCSGIVLLLVMSLAGWSWNLMNIMALPLLLGMGVDFSIHMQLALRRYNGDPKLVRNSIGRALLLAGTTTVTGFGSLIFSSNTGLSSLGKVCAAGIAVAMLISVFVLPVWWRSMARKSSPKEDAV